MLAKGSCRHQQETEPFGFAAQEVLAPRQRLGDDVIGYAHALKIEALAGLGLVMAASEKAIGARGRGPGRGKKGALVKTRLLLGAPSLKQQGVSPSLANKARKMATLTGAEVTAVVSRDKTLAAVTKRRLSPPLLALTARPSAVSGGAQGRRSAETPMKVGSRRGGGSDKGASVNVADRGVTVQHAGACTVTPDCRSRAGSSSKNPVSGWDGDTPTGSPGSVPSVDQGGNHRALSRNRVHAAAGTSTASGIGPRRRAGGRSR